jgi:hypothetical protein
MSGFQGNWFEIFEDIKKEFDAEKAKLQKLIKKPEERTLNAYIIKKSWFLTII